ncbi:permease-like cell division protein FtsX [Tessaracoccus oleiagri]|uniref:Cell division protein FtsX n=1 Tax=Tessaracoccus oleiagri TaxID=686624 RepID=A0A1G9MPF0_9ACTN|nr:permease-like cell division protein FtsX [Tessaracoccus oleiagri]SDL75535.1 cell division transport system permease protein [Tessaracoccus oleiagri]
MRHTLRETWSGLRRNLAMTIAVVVTVGVSLTLFGAGLLTASEVNLVKGRWYDKIEISVFLCTEYSSGGNCEAGKGTTEAQRASIQQTLEANPEVEEVFYESKDAAFEEFQRVFADSPILPSRTAEQMQDSFRIKLVNPENYQGVVSEASGLQGVQNVQDLRGVLDPMFRGLSAVQWATIVMSAFLLLAAALQISNTIRIAAFTRRREIGIMRLVGASNLYIVLPFLLESLVAGLIGVLIAALALSVGYYFIVVQNAQTLITALPWIGWSDVLTAILIVAVVGIALAIIPTLFATRKYVQI